MKTLKPPFLLLLASTLLIFLGSCEPEEIEKEPACEQAPECSLEPEIGPCFALFTKYYFDQEEGICKPFTWGGCGGVVPFDTYDECLACECNDEATNDPWSELQRTGFGVNSNFTFGYMFNTSGHTYDSFLDKEIEMYDTVSMSTDRWFYVDDFEHNVQMLLHRDIEITDEGVFWTSSMIDTSVQLMPWDLEVGQQWEDTIVVSDWTDEPLPINYEVLDYLSVFKINSHTYEEVYVLQETHYSVYRSNIFFYWVTKAEGIIQTVVPAIVNNRYLPTVFQRLELSSIKEDCQNHFTSGISYEDAVSRQIIYFNIGDRHVKLTEFKTDPWPFHGTIVATDSIEFDSNSEYPVSRALYAAVPRDKSPEGHVETVGFEFNTLFNKSEIDIESNRLLNDNQFQKEFLKVGLQDITLSNFGFHQTYLIGQGQAGKSRLEITAIDVILDRDNAILVTGTFEGGVGHEFIGEITYGHFRVIIEN